MNHLAKYLIKTLPLIIFGLFSTYGFAETARQTQANIINGIPSSISISDASVIEGKSVVFVVTRSFSYSTQTIDYATREQSSLPNHQRALSGGDYTPVSGTLVFTPGQTSKTISVNTRNDGTNERDNTFEMVLSNASSGVIVVDGIAVGTIINNDPTPRYFVSANNANEGSPLTYTITTDRASEITYTIDYATSDSGATSPADYSAKSGTLTYGWNNRSKTISVPTVNDSQYEADEGVRLTLSNLSGGGVISTGSAIATILNDDDPTPPDFSISNASRTEGNSLQFTVSRSNSVGTNTIQYATREMSGLANNVRALAGGDYTSTSGTLVFSPGQSSRTISVTTQDDTTNESDNTFEVILSNASSGATISDGVGVGTIINNDPAPNYSVTASNANEGEQIVYTITADRASELVYNLDYATSDGGAVSPSDYTATSGTLNWGWNQNTKVVEVSTIDDNAFESEEGVTLTLSNATNGAGITIANATANILDNDTPATSDANVAPVPAPAEVADPGEDSVSTAVGTIEGQFQVDGSGSATYSIPIYAPKGVANVSPQLALGYSSRSSNGLVGLGWNISGLSSITRCRQTQEQDGADVAINLTTTDRFCLDGQKLIVVNGGIYGANATEYRTAIDSQMKIISYGQAGTGPAYFVVWNKDGSVSEYGNSNDSGLRHNQLGTISPIIVTWALNQYADNMGNSIDFSYQTDHSRSEQVIDEIRYAPNNIIRFHYATNRIDNVPRFGLGAQSELDKRLISVQSIDDGIEVRNLDLSYVIANGKYQMNSISQSAFGISTPSTTFTWSQQTAGYHQGNEIPLPDNYRGAQQADLNGDGRQDLVYIYQNNDRKYLKTYLSNGNYYTQNCTGSLLFDADDDNEDVAWHTLDYNADGRTDVILARDGFWHVSLATNAGCLGAQTNTGIATNGMAEKALLMDINADGLADLVRKTGRNKLQVHHLGLTGNADEPYAFSSSAVTMTLPIVENETEVDGFEVTTIEREADLQNFQLGDFNGDGRADLVIKVTETEQTIDHYENRVVQNNVRHDTFVYTLNEQQQFVEHAAILNLNSSREDLQVLDLNADGLADIIYRNNAAWWFRINTGTSLLSAQMISGISKNRDIFIADENLDGYPDLHYVFSEDYLYVARGTGQGFERGVTTGLISDITNEGYVNLFSDVNGDGLADHVFFKAGTNDQRISLHRGAFQPSPRIKEINNGLDLTTYIQYKALTDLTQQQFYTKGTGAALLNYGNGSPIFDLLAPVYLVSDVSSSAPSYDANGNYQANHQVSIQYRYAEARMQGGGRGFLGFKTLMTIDMQTGITTKTGYHQAYPYTGMPQYTEVISDSGNLLQRSDNSYDSLHFHNNAVVFPYLKTSTEQNYVQNSDGSSQKIATVTTTNHWQADLASGNHANLIDIVVETKDSNNVLVSRITTNNDYLDNVDEWWLGRITDTTTTHYRPGQANITRQSAFDYYPIGHINAGMLKHEVVDPNGNETTYLRTLYCYDDVGNLAASVTHSNHYNPQHCQGSQNTNSGAYNVYRRELNQYDFDGRYLTNQANDKFDINTINHRNTMGLPTQMTDINNVVQRQSYDAFGRAYYSHNSKGEYRIVTRRLAQNASQIGAPNIEENYQIVEKTEQGGTPTGYQYYDVLGQDVASAVKGFDGRWILQYRGYDDLGRIIKVSEPHFQGDPVYWTQNQYDVFGRNTTIEAADGTLVEFIYSGLNTTTRTHDNGRYGIDQSKTETNSALGELSAVQDPAGTIHFTYNAIGNLIQTADVDGISIVATFDSYGRKTALSDPDRGVWTYTYNALGEVVTQSDANNHVTHFYRDSVGQQVKRIVTGNGVNETTHFSFGNSHLLQHEEIVGVTRKDYTYDNFGRPSSITSLIDGKQYTQSTNYDQFGRIFQQFDASGDSRGLQFVYQNGYLKRQIEARNSASPTPEVYYEVQAMDARNNVSQFKNNNGTTTYRSFRSDNGYMNSILVSNAFGIIQDSQYSFDGIGNLRQRIRHDLKPSSDYATEYFNYDNLNRLTHVNNVEQVRYHANGNIKWKYNVNNGQGGYYCYASGRPHAVSGIGSNVNCNISDYQYDANGNMTSGRGRDIAYSHYNKPTRITLDNGDTTEFSYNMSRKRYKRVDNHGGVSTTTYQIGNVDIISRSDSTTIEYRRTLGNVMHAIWIDEHDANNNGENKRYLHKDHLGSIETISNGNAKVVQKLYHDPWGKQQQINYQDWSIFPNSSLVACGGLATPCLINVTNVSSRGFTGHEHVEQADIIHMNGRIYDPVLGRFLQADPNIQAPSNSQNYNRYAYVLNNPLSYTDPSGYFFGKLFKALKQFSSVIVGAALVYFTGGTASFFVSSWYGAASLGAVAGAVGSAANGGNILKGALVGAFSAAAFYGVGSAFGEVATGSFKHIGKIAAHGVVGGITQVLQNGKFGHGFLSAGLTQAFSGSIDKIAHRTKISLKRIIASAVLGGTASKLAGGKFANGAITAAFSRAFNDDLHRNELEDKSFLKRLESEFNEENFEGVVTVEITGVQELVGDIKVKSVTLSLEVDSTGKITGVAGVSRQVGAVLLGAKIECSSTCVLSGSAGLGVDLDFVELSNKLGFNSNAEVSVTYTAAFDKLSWEAKAVLKLKAVYRNIRRASNALYRAGSDPFGIADQ